MVADDHTDHRRTDTHSSLASSSSASSLSQSLVSTDFDFLESISNKDSLAQAAKQQAAVNSTAGPYNSTKQYREPLTTVFLTSKDDVKAPLMSQEKFHWNQKEQGHILGAFFYGYILFQIPGARLAESAGAKWIIMAASTGSAVISLVFPLSTQLNSIYLLMVLRFVMGLCQSAFFPAAYVLFCGWFPERERALVLPFLFVGSSIGSISTYTMSSYLITSPYGWPSVFYLSGFICLLCSLLWCIVGSNGPHDNWFISDKERRYIESGIDNQSNISSDDSDELSCSSVTSDQKTVSVFSETKLKDQSTLGRNGSFKKNSQVAHRGGAEPNEKIWLKLIKSVPVWTLILSMYGNEWSQVVICYELPTYLNTALGFPIEQNGVINSFFQLSFAVASPIMSSISACILQRRLFYMRKIHVRKLFQSLSTFGQMICFLIVPICGADRGLIILFMFASVVCKACSNAGDIMVAGDLSPEYAGTIFAFANSFGNTAGVVVPMLAGYFVEDAYNREQWTPFWLTSAFIMCFSGIVFLVFGETRRQYFGLNKQELAELEANTKKSQNAAGKPITRTQAIVQEPI